MGIDTSPHSEALAVAAIEYIFKYLVRSTENGDDLEARGGMLIASNMAGTSFSHSMVGCVHGMSHTIGGLYRVPHGVGNTIFLPHGMEYNFEECKEKYAKLAYFMGEDVSGLSVDEAARKAIEAVKNLTAQLNKASGIPIRLRDAGVPEDNIAFARETFTFNAPVSPTEVLNTFRQYYGPTMNAFEAAEKDGRADPLYEELDALFNEHNAATSKGTTSIPATFLRVTVSRD